LHLKAERSVPAEHTRMTEKASFETTIVPKHYSDIASMPEACGIESLTDVVDYINRTAFRRTLERGRAPDTWYSDSSRSD
jgi:hypothetical protein